MSDIRAIGIPGIAGLTKMQAAVIFIHLFILFLFIYLVYYSSYYFFHHSLHECNYIIREEEEELCSF